MVLFLIISISVVAQKTDKTFKYNVIDMLKYNSTTEAYEHEDSGVYHLTLEVGTVAKDMFFTLIGEDGKSVVAVGADEVVDKEGILSWRSNIIGSDGKFNGNTIFFSKDDRKLGIVFSTNTNKMFIHSN